MGVGAAAVVNGGVGILVDCWDRVIEHRLGIPLDGYVRGLRIVVRRWQGRQSLGHADVASIRWRPTLDHGRILPPHGSEFG